MATYFDGNSEMQQQQQSGNNNNNNNSGSDGLQTLVLMNPTGYIPYSDHTQSQPIFLNPHAHPSHAPPNHHYNTTNEIASSFHHGFLPQRVHYNVWTPPPAPAPETTPSPSSAAREAPRAGTPLQQGLSLTLSSHQLGFRHHHHHAPPHSDDAPAVSGVSSGGGGNNNNNGIQSVLLSSKYLRAAQELLEEVVNVGGSGSSGGGDSTNNNNNNGNKRLSGGKVVGESSGAEGSEVVGEKRSSSSSGVAAAVSELTPAERQEVHMKKAKLISMLDEVEQRYRQYHQQMQIVISSFEQAAGMGSARTYTALALQTISKQFRCLKDAIAGQIRAAGKSLGEESDGAGGGSGSRLKFVDHHLRQQRALQQLGMIQHNAWRPQRGLPERSVSVLRAWLFEHFLHPYPKDSDKHMLAKQTGLTRSQVSNWFINARVRLWKPMVEEMYLEEIKEQNGGGDGGGGDNNNNNNNQSRSANDDNSSDASKSKDKSSPVNAPLVGTVTMSMSMSMSMKTPSLSPTGQDRNKVGGFSLVGSSELDGIARTGNSPKKARCGEVLDSPNGHHHHNNHIDVKPGKIINNDDNDDNEDDNTHVISMGRDGYSFMGGQTNFIGGFGQYPIAEIADPFAPRFSAAGANNNNNNNGVSLTLGLPHFDPHHHHQGSFVPTGQAIQLGRRLENHHNHMGDIVDHFGAINASPHHNPVAAAATVVTFDGINIQNPKRFAAQLLPDYVS